MSKNETVQAPRQSGKGHPGVKLDKTLSGIRDGLPAGPERTPGGFGQVWRDRPKPSPQR